MGQWKAGGAPCLVVAPWWVTVVLTLSRLSRLLITSLTSSASIQPGRGGGRPPVHDSLPRTAAKPGWGLHHDGFHLTHTNLGGWV